MDGVDDNPPGWDDGQLDLTDSIQTMTDPGLAWNALQIRDARIADEAAVDAEELADAEAFRLQSQARWACRGVPQGLKHLLCAKKI